MLWAVATAFGDDETKPLVQQHENNEPGASPLAQSQVETNSVVDNEFSSDQRKLRVRLRDCLKYYYVRP